jgi:predicted ATP-binding protein involved in virulence
MQIQKISVSGLFGIFDHVIPLNMDERITIIHGPNGFGKTAMLRMLDGFFNAQYSVFQTTPFAKFCVEFDDDSHVEVLRDCSHPNTAEQSISIICNFYHPEEGNRYFPLEETRSSMVKLRNIHIWIDRGDGLNDQVADVATKKDKPHDQPEWLKNLRSNIHVRLIESQRLLNVADRSPNSYSDSESMLPTVSTYSEEIAQLIQSKLTEYGRTAQSLDRSFPSRVLQPQRSPDLTDDQLRQQLNELEETRARLIEVGLLDKDENPNFQIQPQAIDESTKNILSVYVDDVEKKLSVFDEIANKIDLLRRIINTKFAYSYKEMSFSKEKGFVFKTHHHPNSSNTDTLSPTDLSSGEQHELVLLYELLFKVEPNSLVLIDEPELSLHVGWQSQFLKDLQEITQLADLNILMATHSPDIIQDRWDLTVELKGPERG